MIILITLATLTLGRPCALRESNPQYEDSIPPLAREPLLRVGAGMMSVVVVMVADDDDDNDDNDDDDDDDDDGGGGGGGGVV
jgi:hypothetical protein